MKKIYKVLMILLYMFAPEYSDPSFLDAGKADYSTVASYPGKIKGFFWVILSIASTIMLSSFLK